MSFARLEDKKAPVTDRKKADAGAAVEDEAAWENFSELNNTDEIESGDDDKDSDSDGFGELSDKNSKIHKDQDGYYDEEDDDDEDPFAAFSENNQAQEVKE